MLTPYRGNRKGLPARVGPDTAEMPEPDPAICCCTLPAFSFRSWKRQPNIRLLALR